METKTQLRPRVAARVREFRVPPLRDGLVLGKEASVGCAAIRKALDLLTTCAFTHIEPDDEIVGDIIVRESFFKRLPREDLVDFILREIKPLMNRDEILEIELDVVVDIVHE